VSGGQMSGHTWMQWHEGGTSVFCMSTSASRLADRLTNTSHQQSPTHQQQQQQLLKPLSDNCPPGHLPRLACRLGTVRVMLIGVRVGRYMGLLFWIRVRLPRSELVLGG